MDTMYNRNLTKPLKPTNPNQFVNFHHLGHEPPLAVASILYLPLNNDMANS